MNRLRPSASVRAPAGFTMVEIAICIGIIGFALVAIIGVLPTGMRVQRDNREETIINQDAQFLIEAIRSGASGPGLDGLAQNFDQIVISGASLATYTFGNVPNMNQYDSGLEVIGLLSTNNALVSSVVRAFSGTLADRGATVPARDLAFKYLLETRVEPFVSVFTNLTVTNFMTNAYDLRMQFRWPLLPNGTTGRGRKVFRTLVAGELVPSGTAELPAPALRLFNLQSFPP